MPSSVVLNQGHIWQYLDTFLVVMTQVGIAGVPEWVEAGRAAEHPTIRRTAPLGKELPDPKCH